MRGRRILLYHQCDSICHTLSPHPTQWHRLCCPTDLARPREQSLLAQHDINVLPEGEPHVLLVDLAAANKDVKMVCLLVDRCNCVLSYKVSLQG